MNGNNNVFTYLLLETKIYDLKSVIISIITIAIIITSGTLCP